MATKRRAADGRSKIKLIMFEAEGLETDLARLIEPLTTALRPATIVQQRLIAATAISPDQLDNVDEADAEIIDEGEDTKDAPSAPPRPRRFRTPKVLPIDMTSDVSFVDFATPKNPQTHQMRYLVAAAWYFHHRETPAVTIDHIYTCYRAMKWPTNIGDFDAHLRALTKRQLVERTGRGTYAINHLGIADVDELGGAVEE